MHRLFFSDFHKVGGFTIFDVCLKHDSPEVRSLCLELIATLVQNNPYCQSAVLESQLLPAMLNILDNDTSSAVKTKALYAISCKYYRHAREPLYSNSAVIAWCSQSTSAQNILFWFTVIHSMSQYFTAINFYDVFFIWNYRLGIVVHSGPIRAFKF